MTTQWQVTQVHQHVMMKYQTLKPNHRPVDHAVICPGCSFWAAFSTEKKSASSPATLSHWLEKYKFFTKRQTTNKALLIFAQSCTHWQTITRSKHLHTVHVWFPDQNYYLPISLSYLDLWSAWFEIWDKFCVASFTTKIHTVGEDWKSGRNLCNPASIWPNIQISCKYTQKCHYTTSTIVCVNPQSHVFQFNHCAPSRMGIGEDWLVQTRETWSVANTKASPRFLLRDVNNDFVAIGEVSNTWEGTCVTGEVALQAEIGTEKDWLHHFITLPFRGVSCSTWDGTCVMWQCMLGLGYPNW